MPYSAPTVYRLLPTADAEILATELRNRVPAVTDPHGVCVVLVHGFSGSIGRPALRAVTAGLRTHVSVLSMDLRGHGRSTGTCTFGDREVLDVDAAVGEARRLGYREVVTMGWSMGGAAVVRHAGLAAGGEPVHGHRIRHRPDAVVAVSAASRWFVRDTAPMRRIHWFAETASGRAAARVALGVRIAAQPWPAVPPSPVELIGRIAPTPVLIVHGDRDSYFTLEHPRALAAAAGPTGQLWVVPGFGHAEAAATAGLLDRIGAHLPDLLAGRPEWSARAGRIAGETAEGLGSGLDAGRGVGRGPGGDTSPILGEPSSGVLRPPVARRGAAGEWRRSGPGRGSGHDAVDVD
ncbi:alpha/beta hydrolase [Frankia sp. Mgl5]|uniref:alpha/beta hydrolase n=1 Tax=Frankia sp. Mgl5 TaxID=2933793 RepID=UPI00200D879C|nr:alpha/beta hydrolase [Frankia sp. Mgl5]MCK9925620.1 alpha/beta hydrolase [Frankia sp. Mgl5]